MTRVIGIESAIVRIAMNMTATKKGEKKEIADGTTVGTRKMRNDRRSAMKDAVTGRNPGKVVVTNAAEVRRMKRERNAVATKRGIVGGLLEKSLITLNFTIIVKVIMKVVLAIIVG